MTANTDPNAPGGVSVTFKQEAKDGMWIVFHGNPETVAENIKKAQVDGGLFDTAVEGNKLYKGMTMAQRVLGASPSSSSGNSDAWKNAQSGSSEPPKSTEPAKDEPHPLYAEIESASSTDALMKLHGDNKAAFASDPQLTAAWKAKGKALTNA